MRHLPRPRLRLILPLALLIVLFTFSQALAVTYTVNSTDDINDGVCDATHCSLREAIIAANGTGGFIHFNLPGSPPFTIQPTSPLPDLTRSLVIEGRSQPGYAGTPLIELDGSLAGPLANGLTITGDWVSVIALVINRFSLAGVFINGSRNAVHGSFIGTDASGTLARGNRDGVYIFDGDNNRIGQQSPADFRNVISGNTDDGVNLEGAGTTGNTIRYNLIGLNAAGTDALGNAGDGVKISGTSSGNTIDNNRIRYNVGRGIYVAAGSGAVSNAFYANAVADNGGLGIDLGGDGVTANDPGDADTGPNGLQNFPALTSALADGINLLAAGTLNSAASASYTLDFYLSPACDPSGHGEGAAWVGSRSVITDGAGNVSFSFVIAYTGAAGQMLTATARTTGGSTSEFSACLLVTAGSVATATATPSLTLSLTPSKTIISGSVTPTPTRTPTSTFTPTNTPTATYTPSPTYTPTSADGAAPVRYRFTAQPVILYWQALTWASGYQVQVDSDAAFNAPLVVDSPAARATLQLPNLPNGLYHWRVRARRTDGTWGAWSAVERFVVDTP